MLGDVGREGQVDKPHIDGAVVICRLWIATEVVNHNRRMYDRKASVSR